MCYCVDRAALYVVKDAEEKGLIKPGGTVIEGTAGNTGIGLAHVSQPFGLHCGLILTVFLGLPFKRYTYPIS